jgi:hypothetical protein
MKYFVFLMVFALVFSSIVFGTKFINTDMSCGVSSTSCGVSADVDYTNPYWLPGPAEPKEVQQQYYQDNGNYGNCYTFGCDRWAFQRGEPVRNVVRFFHNVRPLRRVVGFVFRGFRARCR